MTEFKADIWNAVASEGTQLKKQQLEREICLVHDETLRTNLLHTYSKLFMFLKDDLEIAILRARML